MPALPPSPQSEKKTCQIARNRYSLRNDESATDTAKATRGHSTCEEKIVEGKGKEEGQGNGGSTSGGTVRADSLMEQPWGLDCVKGGAQGLLEIPMRPVRLARPSQGPGRGEPEEPEEPGAGSRRRLWAFP